MMVVAAGFEIADCIRGGDSQQESDGKPEAIVGMELHFRQQIAQRDAEEITR